MQRYSAISKPNEEENVTCSECRATFNKPILAAVTTSGNVQKYYACPRCLSKVKNVELQENTAKTAPAQETKKFVVEKLEAAKCEHFVGYLKKRPKDTPIPDECLTCAEIVKCLA
jgi:DNA-directed RNA polymerase subunit RPC12/RpoP